MARKLTDEQEAEVARRYHAGQGSPALARQFEVNVSTIRAVIRRAKGTMRNPRAAAEVRFGIERPGKEMLSRWYLGKDQLSCNAIGEFLGCQGETVSRWLGEFGIPTRTLAEQQAIESKLGRRTGVGHQFDSEERRGFTSYRPRPEEAARMHTSAAVAKRGATRSRNAKRSLPCWWCGNMVERPQSKMAGKATISCCRAHSSAGVNLRRFHPDAPRPLILQQITEAIAQHRSEGGEVHRTLPARFGEPLGATDVEYDAWWNALALDALNDYEMMAFLDWDLDRKIRRAGLSGGDDDE